MDPTPKLRWVLLWHECSADYQGGSHWDLMLERVDIADERRLATWSLGELPTGWPGAVADALTEVEAIALDDHRAAYLEYEGPVSGGRGTVTRVVSGGLSWREASERRVVAELRGGLGGTLRLENELEERWRLVWLESDS